MANIELVIKIPEDVYKDIIENGFIYDEDNRMVADAIKNGTSLPKGHGDLIDRNSLPIVDMSPNACDTILCCLEDDLDEVPVIIPRVEGMKRSET